MNGDCTDRIVELQLILNKRNRYADQKTGDYSDDKGRETVYKSAGSRYGDETGEAAVGCHGRIGFAELDPHVEESDKSADRAGDHRVGGDYRQAEVGGIERRSCVKGEPAEEENNGSDDCHRNIVAGESTGGAVLLKFADTGPEYNGTGQSDHAAHGVNDRGTRKVNNTVSDSEVLAESGEPAAAPYPVAEQRVEEHRDEEGCNDDSRILDTLGHGAGRNRNGSVHENHLEKEECVDTCIIGSQKAKALVSDNAAESGY